MEPGGFGQNIFGPTKGNFNSWQTEQTHSRPENTPKHSTINDFVHCDWYLSNIAVSSKNFEQFSLLKKIKIKDFFGYFCFFFQLDNLNLVGKKEISTHVFFVW